MWQRYLRRLGRLGVLTAVLVTAGVILAVTKDYLGGGVLIAVALVATQLLPRAIEWYKGQRKEDEEEASLLRIRRPIAEVDPFEEGLVFQSALAERDYPDRVPAYIPRGNKGDIDARLDEALQTKRFVLVTGASKSGKTRTALEAVRRMRPEPTLLVPASSGALPKLLGRDLPINHSGPAVLWLDELNSYLQDPGLSRALFADVRRSESRVVILATITLNDYNRLHETEGEIGRSTREILFLFEKEITLPSELSRTEQEEAVHLYPSQRFTAGIGEYFAAARELKIKFKTAIEYDRRDPRGEDNRHGFAVVVAALDWRRAGMPRPITEEELRKLYSPCLERFHPRLRANLKDFQDGVEWASETLESRAALLMPTRDEGVEGFEVFDYVRDWCDGAGSDVDQRLRTVPEPTWHYVIDQAGPSESFAVGVAATTRSELDIAEDAFTKVVASGHSEYAPKAAHNLGLLLKERGDHGRAEELLRQAIGSGHSEAAPKAAFSLGLLLQERGDHDRAISAYQVAIGSGDSEVAPLAALNLGLLLKERGDYDRTEELLRQAIGSGYSEVAPRAALVLQRLHSSRSE